MIRSFVVLLCLLATHAVANDAWMGSSGSPKSVRKHTSIRMVREVIRIQVGEEFTEVDCTFTFHNDGPATVAYMGFPDEDWGRLGDEPLKSAFNYFHSWVDGQRFTTWLELDNEGDAWHRKDVPFAAGQTRTVRDRYRVPTGMGAQRNGGYLRFAGYTLRTGSTWKGDIGDVDIEVRFNPAFLKADRAMAWEAYEKLAGDPAKELDTKFQNDLLMKHRRTVFWAGPTPPKLWRGVLRFRAKNLRPTKKHDVFLAFAPVFPKK